MNECEIGNGCRLYWKDNEVGGRTYFSDEIGGGTFVWDTSLVDVITLLSALNKEHELRYVESKQLERM